MPCTEPCLRACPDNQCSALCSQPCTGKLCSEPCKLLLPCGHPCIGLCGDQCPAKCRVCHSEEVTQVFFGPEDEPDARFGELADCHHVVHAESMDSKLVLVDRLAWQSAPCARQLSGLLAGITMLSTIISLVLRESRKSLEERWVSWLQVVQYLDCCDV